jgi:hypothetical protein
MFITFSTALAEEKKVMKEQLKLADDITKETLAGSGSVQVNTGKDILMSFGALLRVIPTSESDWDFGLSDKAEEGFLFGALGSNFFKDHANEGGWVNNGYIRNEDRLYFNAMPKDRKWSFYAALEFDPIVESQAADTRPSSTLASYGYTNEEIKFTRLCPPGTESRGQRDRWAHQDFA